MKCFDWPLANGTVQHASNSNQQPITFQVLGNLGFKKQQHHQLICSSSINHHGKQISHKHAQRAWQCNSKSIMQTEQTNSQKQPTFLGRFRVHEQQPSPSTFKLARKFLCPEQEFKHGNAIYKHQASYIQQAYSLKQDNHQ